MKILLVNDYGYNLGGAETHFFDLAKLLMQSHQVITVSSSYLHHGKSIMTNYQLSTSGNFFNLDSIFNVKSYFQFKKIISKEKPDIIHYHNIFYQLTPSVVLAGRKCRQIMTLHDYNLICFGDKRNLDGEVCLESMATCHQCYLKNSAGLIQKIKKIIASYLTKKIDCYIAPSQFVKSQFELNGFKPVTEIQHYISGIDNVDSYLQSNSEKYFLYIGRVVEQKGLNVLIEAFHLANIKDTKLYIVGDGPLRDELELKVKELRLVDKVVFWGHVDGKKKNLLLANCIANVLPSIWPEVAGLSILEALLFKKPTIGSDIGGIRDYITHNISGYLVPPGDVNALSVSLKEFVVDESHLNEISKTLVLKQDLYLQKLNLIYKNHNEV